MAKGRKARSLARLRLAGSLRSLYVLSDILADSFSILMRGLLDMAWPDGDFAPQHAIKQPRDRKRSQIERREIRGRVVVRIAHSLSSMRATLLNPDFAAL